MRCGGVVRAALDPVGERDGDRAAAPDQVADRFGAQRVGQRLAGRGDGVLERRGLVGGGLGSHDHRVVGEIDAHVAVAVLELDLHALPSFTCGLVAELHITCNLLVRECYHKSITSACRWATTSSNLVPDVGG